MRCIPTIIAAALVNGVLAAEVHSEPLSAVRAEQCVQTQNLRRLDDPTGRTPNSGLTSKIVFEGSEEKGVATLRVGNHFGSSVSNVYRWSLSASAPFSQDEEDSRDIGDLSGLSAGSTATLELGWIGLDSIQERAWRKLKGTVETCGEAVKAVTDNRIDNACEPYAQKVFGVPMQKVHETLGVKREFNCTEEFFSAEIFDQSPKVLQLRQDAGANPASQRELEQLTQAREKYLQAYRGVLEPPGPLWSAGVRLKAGSTSFDYFLDTNLAEKQSTSKTNTSIGAYLNYVHQRHLIGLGYSRVSNYTGGRKTQVCTPLGTTGALDCSEKVLGAPTRDEPDLLSLEWRYLIAPAKLAISPIVEYDLDEHEWAARVPVYGAVNKEGDLVGGLSINWDSEEDDVEAVVFFGKKFALFE